MYNINIVLFDEFELLDALGPAEIFGKDLECFHLHYCAMNQSSVMSSQKTSINTSAYTRLEGAKEVLLIPGGAGTRLLVDDKAFIDWISQLACQSDYVLSVCTGSALLAKTGLLNHKKATTNKRAFEWVVSQNETVDWQKKARWVVSDTFYTSSGISAGMDMSLGFIQDRFSYDKAKAIADRIEYTWHEDAQLDPFGIE